MDDEVRWSFRRVDVVRAVGFLVAAVVAGGVALGLLSLEQTSGRVFPVIFTTACISGGAALGFVLSVVELIGDVRIERTSDDLRAPSRR